MKSPSTRWLSSFSYFSVEPTSYSARHAIEDQMSDGFTQGMCARINKIAVVYEKSDGDTLVITVIYSSALEEIVDRRRGSGRWI